MTSRLDRLFILLESGSSAVTRRAAAKQIGEVQKLYPHELHALLNRLIGYLHSPWWDTRIAAAQTVEAILQNVPEWKPELSLSMGIKRESVIVMKKNDTVVVPSADDCEMPSVSSTCNNDNKNEFLSFADFNLEQILRKGARLMGSEGLEFDVQDDMSNSAEPSGNSGGAADVADRLIQQRALINEKLGLLQASKFGINLTDMITDEDMVRTAIPNNSENGEKKVPVEDILKIKPTRSQLMGSRISDEHQQKQHQQPQLSSREMNRAKRKARQNAAGNANSTAGTASTKATASSSSSSSPLSSSTPAMDPGGGYRRSDSLLVGKNGSDASGGGVSVSDEPEKKKSKLGSDAHRTEIFYNLNAPVPDATGSWVDATTWPLENFCARLYVDLFNMKWEVRHGAATALRELINNCSRGAGKSLRMTLEEMSLNHSRWLEDAAVRLICVLCLDRFGDFVSDQVVAPVRETCAQVLGTLVKEMTAEKVHEIVNVLLKLAKQQEWEVRHGGLLGLKYIFVVRDDLLSVFLPQTISHILDGLSDPVDDVGAVAASTLIPVASYLPKLLTAKRVSSIMKMLWDLLLDQDEVTSACNSFMGLLAAILSLPKAENWIEMDSMPNLIPRLWPFLSHSSSSVRKSTLITLQSLTSRSLVKEEESIADYPDDEKNAKKCKLVAVVAWEWKLLQDALRHIYQRILVEPHQDIQELAKTVWHNIVVNADLGALLHATCPYVSSWICLAMQPPRLAFDPSILIEATPPTNSSASTSSAASTGSGSGGEVASSHHRRIQRVSGGGSVAADGLESSNGQLLGAKQKLYLGGSEATPVEVRERNYMRARVLASRVIGTLSRYLVQPAPGVVYLPDMESPMDCYTKVLMGHLNSRSAVQRVVCGLIIAFWALSSDSSLCSSTEKLQEKLRFAVGEYVYYDEVAILFTRLLQEAHDFINTLKQYKIPINDFSNAKILTLDQIESLATHLSDDLRQYGHKPKVVEMLEDRRKGLQVSFQQTSAEQMAYTVSAQASLAGAIVSLRGLPAKLNPVVKPLMESIKREECENLQELSAEFLVNLMDQVCDRNPSPNDKIIINLCKLLKSDTEFTPKIISVDKSLKDSPPPDSAQSDSVYYGILTLSFQQRNNRSYARGQSLNGAPPQRGPGRPAMTDVVALPVTVAESIANAAKETEMKQNRTQRIGATCAIEKLCKTFAGEIIRKVPVFEQLMFGKISAFLESAKNSMDNLADVPCDVAITSDLVTSLQLIEIAAKHLHESLHGRLFELLPQLGVLLSHPLKAIRHLVARCIAALADIDACATMNFVVEHLVGLLRKIENVIERQGAVEAIERVVDKLQIKIVPYVVLLVIPLLGCMSDPDECVRLLSTHCFATLVQLMPLDSKDSAKTAIKSKELQERKTRDREFLDYLFTPKAIPDYKVPVPLTVELRSYQQAGVNWLWFLNKYNLHGILCDDMGLGKTLQTICILAGDQYQRDCENAARLPSLVVCPPTLTGHWIYEIEKFLKDTKVLRPLHYVGLPVCREKLRCHIGETCNLVVASYDTIRKDIDYLSGIHWNYCVLDEGHIIKNGKTKGSKAIKMLKVNHRLILSGTPIQNNVLELWSLFDFLMPGFLGTEKQFAARYSRPILASRDSKSSLKEQEAGVLAMEALHRQVLPFLLRRVKEDVLTDLPPKITQDLLCELSPLQERLYEDFSRSHLNSSLKLCLDNLGDSEDLDSKAHIFHALRYLQNVCNHPKLVLNPKHPEYAKITKELERQQSSLNDIEHSAKLPALKQLLLDCGIGVQTETVSQHRALIFCQLKSMLDIVERDLLRKHLPSVTYLRLDGSVPASVRQNLVNNFNSDPSIDVLLLTTQVGGLGLNLTGADTVIFVEHDWNPMRDLQAMDRAHRIGQKKVVNVYRLITRKSLEEKIMGLQKFKLLTAKTVVSSENASLETMGTERIFDLFNLQEDTKNGNDDNKNSAMSSGKSASIRTIIENLPDLWSETQYDDEYDLTNFVQNLKN